MKYFQYTNTIRDLDGKLRSWEDYQALAKYEKSYNLYNHNYESDELHARAIRIKDEELKRKQKNG